MQNPILGALNQSRLTEMIAPFKNMFQMIRCANDPRAMFSMIMQQNPNPKLTEVYNLIQQNGGDPQRDFYAKAKEMGVNGDDIINMLK